MNSAASNGHPAVVVSLIAASADLNLANADGWTPLYSAASMGHLTIVKALIAAGADFNQTSKEGSTPIDSAASEGHLAVVEALIAAGANLNQACMYRWTPINSAADNGRLAVVEALIAAGADINLANVKEGWTPLNLAANNRHLGVVEALIAAGADLNLANENGWTPIKSAVKSGHLAVVEALIAAGVDLNQACKEEWTIMNPAADEVRLTPLILAIKKGHGLIAQTIYTELRQRLQVGADEIVVDYEHPLGSGSFGAVYKGVFNNQPVAVKTVLNEHGAAALRREIEAMQMCISPYVVQLLAVSGQHTPRPKLALEFMDGGDLRVYLDKKRDGLPVDVEYSTLEVVWVVANALADMHHYNVIHRDLNSSNVLLSSTNYIKVADLGLAQVHADKLKAGAATAYWTAPEVLALEGNYNKAVDIYSFGVILTELCTLKVPYADLSLSPLAILNVVRDGSLRPDVGDVSPPWLRQLATECMAHDPRLRPTALDVVERLSHLRHLEALLNATCSHCAASFSISATMCSNCNSTPSAASNLRVLLYRITEATHSGIVVQTTLPCQVCDEACPFTATECVECHNELPNDAEKLQLLINIVDRAMVAAVAA
ncbi:ankyrin repeat domain-containing protein 50-like [Achlya hypogyna]|uniref:Ankyrin repeat domain-containing protein 50-like n=1 Tax=Achlya hypogyna TaxID=1202772 RepID=A0A1V9Y979_ACHHY|nr:ankyrin repeat domain-containing protein 50-like [Achlya hypogyna]